MRKLCTLDDIVSYYPIILIDTSVLRSSLEDNTILTQPDGKKIVREKNHEFKIELMKYIKVGSPFFITPLVSDEYLDWKHDSYKNVIKKLDRRKVENRRKQMEANRMINAAQKEEKRLINTFEENERILKLNESGQILYGVLYERYYDVQNIYELSDADVNFLISGAVLAQTKGSCALLSNDFGIVDAWNCFREMENINSKKFGFFARKEDSKFRRLR